MAYELMYHLVVEFAHYVRMGCFMLSLVRVSDRSSLKPNKSNENL